MVEAMALPPVSKHVPLFRLAKLILLLTTANEYSARPPHPSGDTPGVHMGWRPPAKHPCCFHCLLQQKAGVSCRLSPSDSAAEAPWRRLQLPESDCRSEIHCEIAPTLGTS